MALTIRNTTSQRISFLAGAITAIFAVVLQPLVAVNLPAAFAATQLTVSPSSHPGIANNSRVVSTIAASGYENVSITFNYDIRPLDKTSDQLQYGVVIGGVDSNINHVAGETGDNNESEVSSRTFVIPANADDGEVTIYFKNTGDSASDIAKITRITATGDAKAVMDTVAPSIPSVNPMGGTYHTQQSVTLTSTDNSGDAPVIRYTTDGSTPTTASAAYSTPLTFEATTILKAAAYDAAGNQSGVVTEVYTIESAQSAPKITRVEPVLWNGENYKGINIDFNFEDVTALTGATLTVHRADRTTVTKTMKQARIDWINAQNGAFTTLTAPFVIQKLTYDEATSGSWSLPSTTSWTRSSAPQSVSVEFTFDDSTKNVTLTSPVETNGIEYASLVPSPTVQPCTTYRSIRTTDLNAWNSSETRTKGHSELVDGGLRIYTDDASSDAKAAGYYMTNFALQDLGSQTIDEALEYTAVYGSEPGLQLVTDFNNDGTPDGILAGEKIYGNNWWLSNGSQQFVKDTAPHNGGGNGSAWYGTPDEWLSKFPDAQVKAIGYSLGSGAYADGTITKISLGCTNYTFTKIVEDETKPKLTIKSSSIGSMSDNVFRKADFKLSDNMKVASYTANAQTYTVTPNQYSDANGISVGVRGGLYGKNSITTTDQAGNVSDPYVFYLDNKAPTVTVKDGSIGSGTTFSSVSFKLYDEYKVDKYVLNGRTVDVANNQWSDANYQNIQSSLVEGQNTLVSFDVVGNTTEYKFTYDSVAPGATFTYSHNNNVTKDDVTVTLTATEAIVKPEGWTEVSDNDKQFTRVYSDNTKASVRVSDRAGNSATYAYEVKRIDRNNPLINGVTERMTYRGQVTFSVTDQNFKQVTVNGMPVQMKSTGGWNYELVTPISADGSYTVVASDKAGNQTGVTFYIDTTAPQNVSAGSNQTVKGRTTTQLSGSADGATTYEWTKVSGPGGVTFTSPSSSTTSVNVDTYGTYVFRLTARNAIDNDASADVTVAFTRSEVIPMSTSLQTAIPSRAVTTTSPPLFATNSTQIAQTDSANVSNTTPTQSGENDGEVLAEEDNQQNQTVNTTASDNTNSDDAGCWAFLGLCWYWWVAIVAIIVGIVWFVMRRREDNEPTPTRRLS